MLLEFSTTNFRSIYKKQTLSLIASASRELVETNTCKLKNSKLKAVRSAVIYGANAAGKSNLLRSISYAQWFIINSANLQEGGKTFATPFLFSQNAQNEPTEFEFLFVEGGLRYHYYFALTKERITKEWLVAYPHNKPQRWFEREYDTRSQRYNWVIGINFKGEKAQQTVWKDSTRANALFLSTAILLNNDQLKPVFMWVREKLIILIPGVNINPLLTISLLKNHEEKRLVHFMKAADADIEALELIEEDNKSEPKSFINNNLNLSSPLPVQSIILKVLVSRKKNKSGEISQLDMTEESEGTKKLFELAGGWMKVLDNGATILVDELDRSLHPNMTRFLVSLFHNSVTNSHDAQLIFTTHDTTLLDPELIRRDQVWFVEKHMKCTRLYPLLDYKPRKDEALERGYLKGRYGAIPFIGAFNF